MNTNTPASEPFFDYDVVDAAGQKLGTVDNIWVDESTQRPEYIGAKTGGLISHTYVLPAASAMVDSANKVVRLPYAEDFIKRAPSLSSGIDMTADDERKIDEYYGSTGSSPANHSYAPGAVAGTAAAAAGAAAGAVENTGAHAANAARNVAYGTPSPQNPQYTAQQQAQMQAQQAAQQAQMQAQQAAQQAQMQAEQAQMQAAQQQAGYTAQPMGQAGAGQASYADTAQPAGQVGGVQLRKVVRKERVYVPVDVMREHIEVVGGPQGATEVQPGPPANNAPVGGPPPVPQNMQQNMQQNVQAPQPVEAYAADRAQPGDVSAPAEAGDRSGGVKPLERPR